MTAEEPRNERVEGLVDGRVAGLVDGIEHELVACADGMPTVFVERDDLRVVFERLVAAGFDANTLVTAVDLLPAEPRFEVVWQFLSSTDGARVRVKTRVGEDEPVVPSCVGHWPGAGFSERECFDMFGVRFDGNPDLRRLLMPEEYEHFPLRKDFPHAGIEPDRLYREWDRARRQTWSPS